MRGTQAIITGKSGALKIFGSYKLALSFRNAVCLAASQKHVVIITGEETRKSN